MPFPPTHPIYLPDMKGMWRAVPPFGAPKYFILDAEIACCCSDNYTLHITDAANCNLWTGIGVTLNRQQNVSWCAWNTSWWPCGLNGPFPICWAEIWGSVDGPWFLRVSAKFGFDWCQWRKDDGKCPSGTYTFDSDFGRCFDCEPTVTVYTA